MSHQRITPPPAPFEPAEDILPAGTSLHRVYSSRHRATAFNPGADAMTRATRTGDVFPVARFSFFLSDPGDSSPVPVLYAASTPDAALWESLLRNRAVGSTLPLPHAAFAGKAMAEIVTARPARVASLAGADMHKLALPQEELISCGPDRYIETIPWARAAWEAGHDGIKYVSRQDNSGLVYVFFQRPEKPALFQEALPGHQFQDFSDTTPGCGFDWLSQRLGRWGITATA